MTIKFERFFQNAIMVKGFEVPNPEHAELLSMDPVTHFALSKDPINLGLSNAKSFCVNTNAFWVDAKKLLHLVLIKDFALHSPRLPSGLYYKSQHDRNLRHWRRNFYATNSGVAIYNDGVA